MTRADKAKFVRKAKTHGLSISEFARVAMNSLEGSSREDEEAMERLIKQLREGTSEAERNLDVALQYCAESDAQLAKIDAWMREQGYRR